VALHFVPAATLEGAQPLCPTSSAAAQAATGLASVAEAAAIGANGWLILPRIASARATCAIAERPMNERP
jgi:cobalt-precorrin 5A hydrolase